MTLHLLQAAPVPPKQVSANEGEYLTTDFRDGIERMLAEFEAEVPRDTHMQSTDTPGALDLSSRQPRAYLNHWWIAHAGDRKRLMEPASLIGAVVRNENGCTSPITAVDRRSHRVLTRSGSVYTLGMPETVYAAQARTMLRALGF